MKQKNDSYFYRNTATSGGAFFTCGTLAVSSGKYLSKTWMMINGQWYYFHEDGTAAEKEFVDGYWLRADTCTWDGGKKATWHRISAEKTWWYGSGEWYAAGRSDKIDGTEYRFDRNGRWVGK